MIPWKMTKKQRKKVQEEKEKSNRMQEEATKNIEEEIEKKKISEEEQINVEGLVNVLRVPMKTSTKVVSPAHVPPFPIQTVDRNLPPGGFVL